MAVREFDGVDDFIRMDGSYGALNKTLDLTLLLVIRPLTATPSGDEAITSIGNGASGQAAIYQNTTAGTARWGTDDPAADVSAVVSVGTAWAVLAVTKTAAIVAPRMHLKVLGGGAPTHVDCGATVGTTAGAAANQWFFGRFNSAGPFRDFRLAVAAVFQTALSDAAFDTITAAASTAAINTAGAVSILEFTQASVATAVTDLKGLATQGAINQTTVIADGVDDPAWTFGLAAAAAPVMTPTFQAIPFMGGH